VDVQLRFLARFALVFYSTNLELREQLIEGEFLESAGKTTPHPSATEAALKSKREICPPARTNC
jgi:hypothetical protein